MGTGKTLGMLFLVLLIIFAVLYMTPQLREKVQTLLNQKAENRSNSTTGGESGSAVAGGHSGTNTTVGTGNSTGGISSGTGTVVGNQSSSTMGNETGNTGNQPGGLELSVSASEIYYDPFMEWATVIINVTNNGDQVVSIDEIYLDGYSTTTGVLNSNPEVPISISPGETASINVTPAINLIDLDIYADYPIKLLISGEGNITIYAHAVRAPGWISGEWLNDFLILLTDKVFLGLGAPIPYEHVFGWSTSSTVYGIAESYTNKWNVTGNLLAGINTTSFLRGLEEFLQNNNMSNLSITNVHLNSTYIYINASHVDGGYKQAEVSIAYYPGTNITQVTIMVTEASNE